MKNRTHPNTNRTLTRKLIDLQCRGYEHDYYAVDNRTIQCLQTGAVFPLTAVIIYIDGMDYDQLCNCFKYVHLVDPGSGDKGVLFAAYPLIVTSDVKRHPCNLPVSKE